MIPEPGKQAPAPVVVTVVANQRAQARLVMPTGAIMLVVKVIGGSCTGLNLVAVDEESTAGNSFASCAGSGAVFDRVEPGSYRVCSEKHCAPVTVTATPAKQTAELHLQ